MNIDYHVEVAHNLYIGPHQLIHERVEARTTATTVEILLGGHGSGGIPGVTSRGGLTTVPAHMPRASRARGVDPLPPDRWAAPTGRRPAASPRGFSRAGRIRNRGIAPVWG